MPRLRQHLAHLLPATLITACFAAVAHAIAVAVAARSVGSELLLIGALSFVVTLVFALPGGAILLGVTALLRLKPWASLLLFVLTIQAIAIGVELYLFESSVADISWVYGVIIVPASLLAWRVSAYPAYLQTRGNVDA
ncbi:hypothetical protein [Pseudomonas abyssi]|uniref:hypothetical protein n=1 Tax=Pseudomonas abyssi TaxID=170540 RepID=UPI003C7AD477